MTFGKFQSIYIQEINKLKIKIMEEDKNIINITFTDVMQVIASEDTCPNDKMVYIYLLNIIMDLNEKVDKLEASTKKVSLSVKKNVD